MPGNGLAEGVALLGVVNCKLERPPRDSAATGRDIDPSDLNAVHHLVKASSRLAAKHGTDRQPELVEDELCRVDALVTHLVDLAGNGETRRDLTEADLLFDKKGRHAAMRRLCRGVGLDQHGDEIRRATVSEPHLLAGHDVVIAVTDGPRRDAGDVR